MSSVSLSGSRCSPISQNAGPRVRIFVGLAIGPITSAAKFEQVNTFFLSGKEKGSERRGGGRLANVVSKTQCASVTHATENAYLSVYVSIYMYMHHLLCLLRLNQDVKQVQDICF